MINNCVIQPVFSWVSGLNELEQSGKWFEAIELLKSKTDRNNPVFSTYSILAAECWLVLSDWNFYSIGNKTDFDRIRWELNDAFEVCKINFSEMPNYNFLFGYFISMFPEFFEMDDNQTINGTIIGNQMLKTAYEKDPEQLIYELFYRGTMNNDRKYKECRKRIKKLTNFYFPNNTAIEEYFRSVLK